MKRLLFVLSFLSAAILLNGCTKDSATSDTQLSYSFNAINMSASLGATSTASGLIVPALSNGSITWNSASINIAKAEFSATLAGVPVSYEAKNFFGVNTLKPDSLSGVVPLKAGVYENIKFKLTLTESTTNPPLILNGTYTEASGTKIPVSVQLNQPQLLNLEAGRYEVTAGKHRAKIVIELNALVKGLIASDFGQTTRIGTDNKIVVNATTNRALFEKLMARFSNCVNVNVSLAKQ